MISSTDSLPRHYNKVVSFTPYRENRRVDIEIVEETVLPLPVIEPRFFCRPAHNILYTEAVPQYFSLMPYRRGKGQVRVTLTL
jgi:hypothetical protein